MCLENGDSPWAQDKACLFYSPFPKNKMEAMGKSKRGTGVGWEYALEK